MSALIVTVSRDRVRLGIAGERIARAVRVALRAERVRHALVSVTFLAPGAIARINARHLKHRGPTDVISFGFVRERGGPVVADIYIAPAIARANARRHGSGIREELIRLTVHGVLHALGYDHPEGEARTQSPMWRRQETIVRLAMRRAA